MKQFLLTLSLFCAATTAHAQTPAGMFQATDGNWYYYLDQAAMVATSPTVQLINPGYDLQSIAYARAAAMAALGWSIDGTSASHNFPNAPAIPAGVNEGIGMATYGNPPTCMFGGACVADAIVQGVNGWFYRVRFFQ